MTLLDRYIARQYLANIVLLLVLLFAIIIVVDFSLQFDEYAELAAKLSHKWGWEESRLREGVLAVYLVVDLWWPRLFQLFHYLLGLVLVGAMGFTCTQMVRHRELVAMLAGGISLRRMARPLLIVAVAMTGLQVLNTEVILPKLAPLLTRTKDEAGSREMGITKQPLCADSRGRLMYAKRLDLDRGVIEDLWVWERDAEGLLSARITASRATWNGHAWALENGHIQRRTADGQRSFENLDAFETDLDPTALRLRRFEGYSANLSFTQLGEIIGRFAGEPDPPEARLAALERLRLGRPAAMLVNLLALVLCMPFFIRREPTNMIVQSLWCAPVAIIALVVGLLGTTAAVPGLPPQVSVFLPAMVLAPLAIAAVSAVKT